MVSSSVNWGTGLPGLQVPLPFWGCCPRPSRSLSPAQVGPPQVWDSPLEQQKTSLISASRVPGDKHQKATVFSGPGPSYTPRTWNSASTSTPHHDSSSVTWAGRGRQLTTTFSLSYIILHNVPEEQLAASSTAPCWPQRHALPRGPGLPPLHTSAVFFTAWSLSVRAPLWPFFVIPTQVPWHVCFLTKNYF